MADFSVTNPTTPTVVYGPPTPEERDLERRVSELEAKLEHLLNLNLTAEEVDYLRRLVRRG